jgi:hypothetical protein
MKVSQPSVIVEHATDQNLQPVSTIVKRNYLRRQMRWLVPVGLVAIIVVSGGIWMLANRESLPQSLTGLFSKIADIGNSHQGGSDLAGAGCSGTGPVQLTVLPMKPADVSSIIPYGLMVSEHVTPIDHQYFAPANYQSARDSYEVRAPATGHISQIQHRTSGGGSFYAGRTLDEYRVVIDYTCTFVSYYDLLTSLTPDIQSQVGTQSNVNVNIPVKAGEVIGKIGGQTLDFGVWDTTKTLKGFIVPSHYDGEPWKIHVVDPLDYASVELKAAMISLNPRKVAPVSGKIDFDIDGKLSGNWFIKGQGGYTSADPNDHNNWKGHLAFAPNNYDPTLWEASSGAMGSNGSQYALDSTAPTPDTVGQSNGLIKYDLHQVQVSADGLMADGSPLYNGKQTITAKASLQSSGCMLVEMVDTRQLKAEGFVNTPCSSISAFDKSVKFYER